MKLCFSGSQLFKVHNGHIELEPFETRMQEYQERFPKLHWSSKEGEDLVKSPESKSDLARRSELQSLSSKGSTSDLEIYILKLTTRIQSGVHNTRTHEQ